MAARRLSTFLDVSLNTTTSYLSYFFESPLLHERGTFKRFWDAVLMAREHGCLALLSAKQPCSVAAAKLKQTATV